MQMWSSCHRCGDNDARAETGVCDFCAGEPEPGYFDSLEPVLEADDADDYAPRGDRYLDMVIAAEGWLQR